MAKDNNPLLRARAEELVAQENYDLVICDFIFMVPDCKRILLVEGSLLFQHNVEAQIFERYVETASNWPRRTVMSTAMEKNGTFRKRIWQVF